MLKKDGKKGNGMIVKICWNIRGFKSGKWKWYKIGMQQGGEKTFGQKQWMKSDASEMLSDNTR